MEKFLISSYANLRPFRFNATFKAIQDLHFDGLPNEYSNHSMTRMQGSQYLMNVRNYDAQNYDLFCVDIQTLKANKLELDIDTIINCFVEGDYVLMVRFIDSIAIFRGLQEIDEIKFKARFDHCNNGAAIRGRYEQQTGQTIYVVDEYGELYRIEWQDIKDGNYCKTLVKSNVEHFYLDEVLSLATLNKDYTLSLASGSEVDLKAKVDSKAVWTIVTCIAKYWIVSGDLDHSSQAIMTSISKQGKIRSKLKLKLTSNGHENSEDGNIYAGIFTLRETYIRGMRGIMLAIERDGCCHLISVMYGRMAKLQSIDSIVNVGVIVDIWGCVVLSVTATRIAGEFIAGGHL